MMRGMIVGLWIIAKRSYIDKTDGWVSLSRADLEWITGRMHRKSGVNAIRMLAERMEYPIRENGKRVEIQIRNFTRKQGLPPPLRAELRVAPSASLSTTNSFPSSEKTKKETTTPDVRSSGSFPSEKKDSKPLSLYALRDVYNEEISRAFGAATDLRFNGDPTSLSPKQIQVIQRSANGHSIEEARLAVCRAIESPSRVKGKLGFIPVMFAMENLLAQGGTVEIEKPKTPLYIEQRPESWKPKEESW